MSIAARSPAQWERPTVSRCIGHLRSGLPRLRELPDRGRQGPVEVRGRASARRPEEPVEDGVEAVGDLVVHGLARRRLEALAQGDPALGIDRAERAP